MWDMHAIWSKVCEHLTIMPIRDCWASHSKTMALISNCSPFLQVYQVPLFWKDFSTRFWSAFVRICAHLAKRAFVMLGTDVGLQDISQSFHHTKHITSLPCLYGTAFVHGYSHAGTEKGPYQTVGKKLKMHSFFKCLLMIYHEQYPSLETPEIGNLVGFTQTFGQIV